MVRLDVDEHDVPIDPDHLRDTAKAGVAVVRSSEREIRLVLFAPASDGNGWTKIDEYPIGAGTQGSMRAVVFLVAIPVTAVLDLVTLPFQGIGCCLTIGLNGRRRRRFVAGSTLGPGHQFHAVRQLRREDVDRLRLYWSWIDRRLPSVPAMVPGATTRRGGSSCHRCR